ncbi:alpha/beta fold hydrolase [Pseudomonas marginalis]|uniref:Hydrolase n=2 Tax=Pseudomonas fluorescens TaxID=294 RepID=C3KD15_PSEFS|nr:MULTISPECIES: alpha/beta hydrolase [Pseudomonas fluorescens group]KJZ51381.1 alpha/beta hydrolase [Pseudomonas marginalis]KJZ54802.1 alpha/beta hydrolase [Pseudomonas marginalis]MBZ6454385.1 alpha/beta hydrolase [Pseudomonas fluorescens group sp.]MBZ6460370.1 alpha/beta hydrolase [Pseudomonas fluorescens group sp.]MBZ6466012.1 alpha/beta hydrolase [Pseudomonas fluorescens group sp.]
MPLIRAFCIAGLLTATAAPAFAATYGPELQGFEYPYPLKHFAFQSQGKSLQMGYMDVPAKGQANGRSVVLMHGKNFCGATWEGSIKALSDAGYRVIAPDQIGFCSSSKPDHYQYSFQQLALNTHQLLEKLGIQKATLLGHSTGGMLATRYALMYPEQTEQLAMVNPIGLEDWKALGVPSLSVDQWYERELKVSAEGIRNYQLNTYYVGRWKPEYERWVDMYAGLSNGPGHTQVAWNSALIYDMIFTQPVYYEFKDLQMPTLLLIGTSDNTAIGKDIAPPAVKAKLGDYAVLGKQAAKLIPHATLVEFPGLGHAPQMEEPAQFHKALLQGLNAL